MQCPACGVERGRHSGGKKMWSDVQWLAWKPIVRDATGHVRNCCAACSQEVGYYCTTKVQCAPAAPWSIEELRTRYDASVAWLQFHIPCGFWDLLHDHLAELDRKHRGAIVQRNIMAGLSEKKTLLKWMSYDGALCLSESEWKGFDVPGSWTDPADDKEYLDPGNYLYHQVFRTIWPACRMFQHYNCEHTADYVEAFFAYDWRARRSEVIRSEFIQEFVQMLTRAFLSATALYFYHRIYAFETGSKWA